MALRAAAEEFSRRKRMHKTKFLVLALFLAVGPAWSAKFIKTKPELSGGPPVWEAPEPGHKVDGAGQLILAGTDVTFYLTGGSAQVDLRAGEGRVFIPAGARFKERIKNSFRHTKRVPRDGAGKWYDRNVRRLIFLAGKSVGTENHPFRVEGDSWLIVRGYNAVVQFKMAEKGEQYAKYRFPIRDPKKEEEERRRERERLNRVNSNDPNVRAQARFKEAGGLYRMSKRSKGGVFTGY